MCIRSLIHGSILAAIALAIPFAARADRIDRLIEEQLRQRNLPGLALAVVQGGKLRKARGYGLADVELNVPATEHSVFQWASVSKQFTASAIMMLVQDGKLRLADPIGAYYPHAPAAWSNVTIRHLVTHTSGIKNYTDLPSFFATARKDYTPDEIVGLVKDRPLDFAPGERWSYSNTGYYLLGLVIEKASGESYADFLAARIFRPAGMATARVNHQFALITNRATGYAFQSNRLMRAEFVSPTQPYAAGALVGTVLDLARWDSVLYTDRILPAPVRAEMWTPVTLNDGESYPYGYGWQVGEIRGHAYVGHGGGIPGFSSFILRLTQDKLTVIVLVNADADPQGLAVRVADLLVPGLTLRTIKPQPDTEPALSSQLKQCLIDLAATKDSALLTPSFRRNFARSERRHAALQEDLRTMRSFTFAVDEKPAPGQRVVDGAPVQRLRSYSLKTAGGFRYYTFALTEDNHVASVRGADE